MSNLMGTEEVLFDSQFWMALFKVKIYKVEATFETFRQTQAPALHILDTGARPTSERKSLTKAAWRTSTKRLNVL